MGVRRTGSEGEMADEFRERTEKKGKRPDLFVVRLKCSLSLSLSLFLLLAQL